MERFPENAYVDPMEQLQHLKQLTKVDSYINAYESWMTLMKRNRSYLPWDFFVERFLSGLKGNIRHIVQCKKSTTLLSAYWYARQYEKSNISNSRRVAPVVPSLLPQARNAANRDTRNKEDKPREPHKCWYCLESWTPGHKCQTMQGDTDAGTL
jgi:hypothetical protein